MERQKRTSVYAEDERQWYGADVLWSYEDWLGPIIDRFWASCELENLVNVEGDVRFCGHIREQWSRIFG